MRVYDISIKITSPVLVVRRRGMTGFMGLSSGLLPGSTLRGAILTVLRALGVKDVEEESLQPTIAITPAKPVKPAKCSLSHGLSAFYKPSHPRAFYTLIGQENVQKACREGLKAVAIDSLAIAKRKKVLSLLRLQAGVLLAQENGLWREFKPRMLISTNVAISKRRGAGEGGMLFHTIATSPGLELEARLIDASDKLMGWLDEIGMDMKGFEIRIGRGVSRGLGRAIIERAREVSIDDEVEKLTSSISELQEATGHTILMARSPICRLSLRQKGLMTSPMPSEIELPTKWMEFCLGTRTGERCKLKLEKGDGPYGSVMLVKGFSVRTGRPKPWLKASIPGTLARYEVEGDARQLAYACVLGLNELCCLGLNFFSPFLRDELPHISEVEEPWQEE